MKHINPIGWIIKLIVILLGILAYIITCGKIDAWKKNQ